MVLYWKGQKSLYTSYTPIAAMLIEKISANVNRTGAEMLQHISKDIGYSNLRVVIQGGRESMYEMIAKHIFLATNPKQIPLLATFTKESSNDHKLSNQGANVLRQNKRNRFYCTTFA